MSKNNLHITEGTIQAYLEGRLNTRDSNHLERMALTDQYLSDRLAGVEVQKDLGIDKGAVNTSLLAKLNERTQEKNKTGIWLRAIGIAATLFIVGGFSFFLWKNLSPQEDLAILKEADNQQEMVNAVPKESNQGYQQGDAPVVEEKNKKQEKTIPKNEVNEPDIQDYGIVEKSNKVISIDEEQEFAELKSPPKTERVRSAQAPVAKSKPAAMADVQSRVHKITKGKVEDEFGDALPGVSVTNITMGISKSTDISGEFEISSTSDLDKLSFEYIGFEGKTIEVGSVSKGPVVLIPDNQVLSEVVISKEIKDQAAQPKEGWKVLNEARRIDSEIQGRVNVSFDISPNGSMENIKITKSLNAKSDAEALKVLSKFNSWTPQIADGKPIKTSRKLSFKFLKKKED